MLTTDEHLCSTTEVTHMSKSSHMPFFGRREWGTFSHFPEFAGEESFPLLGLEHHQVEVDLMVKLPATSWENKHHVGKQQKCFPGVP